MQAQVQNKCIVCILSSHMIAHRNLHARHNRLGSVDYARLGHTDIYVVWTGPDGNRGEGA